MGTGKYSGKLGKSAVTSHEEPWQTDRGRRETTTPHLNGRLPHKRKLLQWKPSLVINSDKTLMTPKGDHIPKEDRRRTTVKGSPLNQAREEESRLKNQHRPVRRPDSRADQRKPKPTASAWGSGTARRPKCKPNQRRESNVTIVDWGRTQTRPEIGDLTWRLGTPQDPGVQRHSSATRASQQVPDKEPG